MSKPFYVHAEWNDEAQVWVATSEAVPGLVTEAATTEALMDKLRAMIPELLAANGIAHEPPVAFELLTRRFALTD